LEFLLKLLINVVRNNDILEELLTYFKNQVKPMYF